MKLETRKISNPPQGRKGEKALPVQVQRPESWLDCIALCDGDEARALDTFQSGYVVKLATPVRPLILADGSRDAEALAMAKVWIHTGATGGGARGPSLETALAELEAEGKKQVTVADLRKRLEDKKAALAAAREAAKK